MLEHCFSVSYSSPVALQPTPEFGRRCLYIFWNVYIPNPLLYGLLISRLMYLYNAKQEALMSVKYWELLIFI